MAQTTQRARRQALEEQRADRPSVLTRLAPVLKVAASVILVLGVGGLIWQLVSGSGRGTTTAESASGGSATGGSAAGAPVLAQVRSTGTNYRKADLGRQVDTLIEATQKAALNGQAATDSASGAAGFRSVQPPATTKAQNQPEAATAAQASGAGHDLLLQPAALRACLEAIGVGGEQPVAVDLARYANRDAAIIVLNADGGGYDVWVVARDCRPGADGTIANVHLDS
jgi:hypothetical protein